MILNLEMPNMDGVEVLHELVKLKLNPYARRGVDGLVAQQSSAPKSIMTFITL
ncbi:MAG: hypothetical protein WAO12_04345 [Venatoribacter sp.]